MAEPTLSGPVVTALSLARQRADRGDREGARAALASVPGFAAREPRVLLETGGAALSLREAAFAEQCFRLIVERDPAAVPGWCSLALALAIQHRDQEAFSCARRARELAPTSAAVVRILASTAVAAGAHGMAIAACRETLARFPGDTGILSQLATALWATGAADEARLLLQPLAGTPQATPELYATLGALLGDLGDPETAFEYLHRAIDSGYATVQAWYSLGCAHLRLKQYGPAEQALRAASAGDPSRLDVQAGIVHLLRETCRWDDAVVEERKWSTAAPTSGGSRACSPMTALYVESTPQTQLAVARAWSEQMYPRIAGPAIVASRGSRLRLGYLSADFHAHPIARLSAGLFECHHAARIDLFAYSCGPDDGSALRKRLKASFTHWVDGPRLSDDALAEMIRADAIDVLVELTGHLLGNRLGVMARRPAPVQVHYLGYPGTLGFDGVDAIVADAIVVPPGDDANFHENVLRLPRCYQVNDRRRALPPRPARAMAGLPEDAVVLVSFNQTYKLSRQFFEIWLLALAREPRAVLWLLVEDDVTRTNLRREAARAGIDPGRLVFASNAPQDEHIARLRSADLALDTLPYGSHTTGSDALWSGVPILTCRGSTFAGRVGASLLKAVGLSELVTESVGAYRDALLSLVGDRERLAGYRDHLERGRYLFTLFDTEGFTRDFERLLFTAVEGNAARQSVR